MRKELYVKNKNYVEVRLSEGEIEFLGWAAKDLTYPQVAGKMFKSYKTIMGYREDLCKKLKIKTRVGLVVFAIQKGIIKI